MYRLRRVFFEAGMFKVRTAAKAIMTLPALELDWLADGSTRDCRSGAVLRLELGLSSVDRE